MNKLATSKKIIFIIPNIVGDKGAATAPLPGVAYLASMLRSKGHNISLVDMRVEPNKKDLFNKIQKFSPDFIGISFMAMEFEPVFEFVNMLKLQFPEIPIVIGGAGGSTLGLQVLEKTSAEFLITREGEYALLDLLDEKKLEDIAGLAWKKDGKIIQNNPRQFEFDLDKLPFPAYDIFPMNKYIDSKIPIVTSRGCPYQCTFCANKASMGAPWRPRSPENIFAEIKHWYDKGFRQFHFVDDNFTFDMHRAEKICDLIIQSGIKIKWDLRNGIRADKIDENLLTKMKKSGCFYYALGIESIDQDVLNKMKKNLNVEDIYKAIEISRKVGIPFGGFFIIGLIGDTFEKFLKCYNFAKTAGFSEIRFYNPIPFPGTELYEELVEKNLLRFKPEEYLNTNSKTFGEEPIFVTPKFSAEERKIAFRMGQNLVMQKILTKEFGSFGNVAFTIWKIKPIRKFIKRPGFFVWKILRRAKRSYKPQ